MARAKKIEPAPRRGDVYLVAFHPTIGAEVKKTRPALILQNDIANRWSPITIVSAVSSRFEEPLYPTEVRVRPPEGGLGKESVILLKTMSDRLTSGGSCESWER